MCSTETRPGPPEQQGPVEMSSWAVCVSTLCCGRKQKEKLVTLKSTLGTTLDVCVYHTWLNTNTLSGS